MKFLGILSRPVQMVGTGLPGTFGLLGPFYQFKTPKKTQKTMLFSLLGINVYFHALLCDFCSKCFI